MLTVTMAANKFYSGRLRIVFDPRMPNPTGANDSWSDAQLKAVYNDNNRGYSAIVDVRDATTFTIRVPYVAPTPFLPTWSSFEGFAPAVFIFVEDPLKKSGTVNDTIDGWISVSGADNFEFAGALSGGKDRLLPFGEGVLSNRTYNERKRVEVPQEFGLVERQEVSEMARTQSGVPQNYTQNQTSDVRPSVIELSNPQPVGASLVAQAMAVGDPVLSLRTLVKRPSEAAFLAKVAAGEYIAVNPFMNLNFTGELHESDTYLGKVRALYRFSTGGLRVHFFGLTQAKNVSYRVKMVDLADAQMLTKKVSIAGAGGVFTLAYDGTTASVVDMSGLPAYCETRAIESLTGVASYEIPYYHYFEKVDNTQIWANGSAKNIAFSAQLACPMILAMAVEDQLTNISVQVSAADDFNCGWLSGPPITYSR